MGDLTPFPGLAGYVDILGQRHELDKLMNTQWWKPNPSTLEIWKNTWGRVVRFREDTEQFFLAFDNAGKASVWNTIMGPDTNPSLGEHVHSRIKTRYFGDSALLVMSLDVRNGFLPLGDMNAVMTSCNMLLMFSLARGYPIRGGIEIGPCLYDPDGKEEYGVAISDAVKLEDQADYHRILIGERLYSYLQTVPTSTGNLFMDANHALAPFMISQIQRDDDGKLFLDFLGERAKEAFLRQDPKVITHALNKATEFIAAELANPSLPQAVSDKSPSPSQLLFEAE